VVHEDHAHRARVRLRAELLRAHTREIEAGHDVGNDHHVVAVNRAHVLLAIRGVGDREGRVRMRMVDVLVGQDRVQDRFDRGRRRPCASHLRRKLVHHLRVRERLELRELLEVRKPHRGEAGLLDRFEVPAAAFHVQDVLLFAGDETLFHLDRSIAPPVQHERGVAAEELRGVHAQSEVGRVLRGFGVIP
jgi:hypothetical protein